MQRFHGDFLNQRTLIVGEVNTGKTRTTLDILTRWIAADPTRPMTILDLAPEPVGGIGGRLSLPSGFNGRYLFADIVPPRLTGRTPGDIARLAAANARAAEPLLAEILARPHPILVVNDASLYLQAGDYRRFTEIIQSAATVLINAYYGTSLGVQPISHRERRLTERLMRDCDRVIWMPEKKELKAQSSKLKAQSSKLKAQSSKLKAQKKCRLYFVRQETIGTFIGEHDGPEANGPGRRQLLYALSLTLSARPKSVLSAHRHG